LRFGRKGDDVTLEVPITITEAVVGTKLTIPTPHGGKRTIKVPSGTTSGRTLRVRGEGAPRQRGGTGDLLVSVKLQVPARHRSQGPCPVRRCAPADHLTTPVATKNEAQI